VRQSFLPPNMMQKIAVNVRALWRAREGGLLPELM
jgi:hypothetical protein